MPLETISIYFVLFIAAVFSGLIDAIAGGGGLIALPALLAVGVPPQIALGTNKFQSSFGSFTASLYYWRKGLVDLQKARNGIISLHSLVLQLVRGLSNRCRQKFSTTSYPYFFLSLFSIRFLPRHEDTKSIIL